MNWSEIEEAAKRVPTLAPRETEVFHLSATGLTIQQLASKLGISTRTVEAYRTRIVAKLGMRRWSSVTLVRQCQILQERGEFESMTEAGEMAREISSLARQLAARDDAAGGVPSERLRAVRDMIAAVAAGCSS